MMDEYEARHLSSAHNALLSSLDTARQILTQRTIELDDARRILKQRTVDHDAVVAERNELAERVARLEAIAKEARTVEATVQSWSANGREVTRGLRTRLTALDDRPN